MGGFLRGFIFGLIVCGLIFVGLSALFPLSSPTVATAPPAAVAAVPTPADEPAAPSAPGPAPAPAPAPQAVTESVPQTAPQTAPLSVPTPDAPGDGSGLEIQAPSFGGSAATTSDVGLGGGQDTRPERPASIGQVAVASNPSAAQPTVDTASAAVPDVSTEVVLEDTGAPAEGRVNLTPATLVPGAALTDNAVAFDVAPGKPLMSIILLDTGAAEALRQGLLTLSAPITFGVTASLENAPLIAAAYRTAGNEVVAVLPDAGQVFQRGDDPAAFRALISGALAAVPVATALVDRVDGPLPLDPNLAQGAIDTLTVTGHALLTHRGVGLNRVPEQAAEADVTGGIIYRVVGGQPGDITAALDQAVAEAAQTGSVIVMGRMEPQTVTALFSWLLGPVANRVSIAPVSTVLAN